MSEGVPWVTHRDCVLLLLLALRMTCDAGVVGPDRAAAEPSPRPDVMTDTVATVGVRDWIFPSRLSDRRLRLVVAEVTGCRLVARTASPAGESLPPSAVSAELVSGADGPLRVNMEGRLDPPGSAWDLCAIL